MEMCCLKIYWGAFNCPDQISYRWAHLCKSHRPSPRLQCTGIWTRWESRQTSSWPSTDLREKREDVGGLEVLYSLDTTEEENPYSPTHCKTSHCNSHFIPTTMSQKTILWFAFFMQFLKVRVSGKRLNVDWGYCEWIPSGVSDGGWQLLRSCASVHALWKVPLILTHVGQVRQWKASDRWMDVFQIIHEALGAPRRQPLTGS